MKRIAAGFGRIIVFVAVMAFITGASLFVVGGYLVTYPILRQAPATRRKRALVNGVLALMALGQAFESSLRPPETPEDR